MADQIALEFVPLVDQFLERVRQLAREAQQALLPLEQGEQLSLDIGQAEEQLNVLREQLLALGTAPVRLNFDDAAALEGIEVLRARLVELQAAGTVAIDPAPAVAALGEVAAASSSTAAALGSVATAAAEVGPEVAAGTAPAAAPLVKISEAAYRAALAVDAFSRQAANASEVTPSLSLSAGRAATAIEELEAAIRSAAAEGGPVSPGQIATLQALQASLQQAMGAVQALGGAQAAQGQAAAGSAAANQGAAGAATAAGSAAATASGGVASLTNAMRGLISATSFYLGMRIVRAFRDIVEGSLDAEEALARITSAFERSRGAGEGAAAELTLVKKTADSLGLSLPEMAEHYGHFTETLKGGEVSIRTQQSLLLGVSAALAATHQPAEKAGQAFEIFSRLAARDEVQVRQLASALNVIIPGSMRIAAEALFKGEDSLARFEAAAKKGQISALDFLEVIGPAYIREFQGQLPAAVDSTTAALNRLHNAEFEAEVGIGEGFAPQVHKATEEFRAFLATAGDTPRALGETVAAFVWLGTKLGELVGSTVKYAGALVTEVFGRINSLFSDIAGGLAALSKAAHLDALAADLRGVQTQFTAVSDAFLEETSRMVGQSNDLAAGLLGLTGPAKRAADGIGDVIAHGKDFADGIDAQVSAIRRHVDAIERQADALGRTGAVEREAADDLVKSIDKELRAISELPQAERRALADRKASLDQLRVHYEQFTSAYIRLQEQQQKAAESTAAKEAKLYKEREDALLRFLGKIQADEDKAAAERAKRGGDLTKSLEAQKGRLGELQGKPTNTAEELSEMDALRKSIEKTEQEAQKLKEAQLAAGDAGARAGSEADAAIQRVRNGFAQAIAEDEKLREAIAQLGPASRSSLGAVLENLARLKGEGRLTEDDLRAAGAALVGIFTQAGVVTAGLRERVAALTHQSGDLRQTLAEVKTTAQEMGVFQDAAATSTTKAAAAAQQAGQAHRFNAEAQKEQAAASGASAAADEKASSISIKRAEATSGLNEQLRVKTTLEPQLAGEIDKTTTAQEKATQAQQGATAGTIEFRGHVVELSKATNEAAAPSGGIVRMGDKVVEIGNKSKDAAKSTTDLATSADKAASGLDKTATAADRAGTAVKDAGGHLIELKDGAASAAETSQQIASGLSGIATAGAKVPPALAPIFILLGQIVNLKAGDELTRMDDALASMGADARSAAEGIKELLKLDLKPLEKLADFLEKVQVNAAKCIEPLSKDVQLLKDLKTCQDALSA